MLPVGLTGPISGWITICVAFDTFQFSCHEVPPRWLAVNLITGLLSVVCGGGAKNKFFLQSLTRRLAPLPVHTSDEFGIAVDHVESISFALFALDTLRGRAINLPVVTGARRPVICGLIALGSDPRHVDRLKSLLLR